MRHPVARRSRYWSLFHRPWVLSAASILALLVIVALLGPLFMQDPFTQSLENRLKPPAFAGGDTSHLLGTDQLGRDVLSRLVQGARVSLMVGVIAVAVSGVLGVLLGLFAGFYRGLADEVIMRIVDLRLALPFILLVIAIIAVFGPSLTNLILVLALTGWAGYARVVRAEVLSVREREFVLAARSMGASDWRLMTRHILPNTVSAAVVIASLELAQMVITESALSFLGLGIQPPVPSWGNMLGEGREYLLTSWWLATFPGVAIAMTAVSINIVGDWLRDVLNSRVRL